MVGTSLSPVVLPKAAALTDALVAPPSAMLADEVVLGVRKAFVDALRAAAEGLGADRLMIDAFRIRALTEETSRGEQPFRWSPQAARRSIGIEAARACLARAGLTPLAAANDEVDRLVLSHEQGGSAAGTLGEWLAQLHVGARAVVIAEAAGWTSQLVSALEWERLVEPVVGANRRVVVPDVPNVALRMRFEAAHRSSGDAAKKRPAALFLMLPGRPASTVRLELGLAALAVVVDARTRATPHRVIGWWPQSGRALVVPVDEVLLRETAGRVVAAVQRAPRSGAPTSAPMEHQRPVHPQVASRDLRAAS